MDRPDPIWIGQIQTREAFPAAQPPNPAFVASSLAKCLKAGGIDVFDLDALAYYERPVDKLSRQLWAGVPEGASPDLAWLDPGQPERAIRERLGYEGPILTYPHHLSHAASAFFYSRARASSRPPS